MPYQLGCPARRWIERFILIRQEGALSIGEQLEREWRERMEIYKAQKAQRVTPCRRAARSRTQGCVMSSGRTSCKRAGMHASDRLCQWLPSRTLVSCMRRPSLAARLSVSSCPRHWPVRTARTAARR